jgi:hypothetical protein
VVSINHLPGNAPDDEAGETAAWRAQRAAGASSAGFGESRNGAGGSVSGVVVHYGTAVSVQEGGGQIDLNGKAANLGNTEAERLRADSLDYRCGECPAGTFGVGGKSKACLQCSWGRYQPERGHGSCIATPEPTASPTAQPTGKPTGAPTGGPTPASCPAGQHAVPDASGAPGTPAAASASGTFHCVICGPGRFSTKQVA